MNINVSWAAYGFLKDNGIDDYTKIPNIHILAKEICKFFKDTTVVTFSGKKCHSREYLESMLELGFIYEYVSKEKKRLQLTALRPKKKKVKKFNKGSNYRKFVNNSKLDEVISKSVITDSECDLF